MLPGGRKGKKKIDRTVYGDLFRVPSPLYRGSYLGEMKGYKMVGAHPSEDTWIDVWATSKDYPDVLKIDLTEEQRNDPDGSCNWTSHGHPRLYYRFPLSLPLTLFLNEEGKLKDDGDTISLEHDNPETKERILIILTLN